MLFWHMFLVMCIGTVIITVCGLACIILGFLKVITLNAGLWIVFGVFEFGLIIASIIAIMMLHEEIKERKGLG